MFRVNVSTIVLVQSFAFISIVVNRFSWTVFVVVSLVSLRNKIIRIYYGRVCHVPHVAVSINRAGSHGSDSGSTKLMVVVAPPARDGMVYVATGIVLETSLA